MSISSLFSLIYICTALGVIFEQPYLIYIGSLFALMGIYRAIVGREKWWKIVCLVIVILYNVMSLSHTPLWQSVLC